MASRPTQPPPALVPAHLTHEKMRTGIERLRLRIAELEAFNVGSITQRDDPAVLALEKAIEETLQRVFGAGTIEQQRYSGAARLHQQAAGIVVSRGGGRPSGPPPAQIQGEFTRFKTQSIALLGAAIKGLEEDVQNPSAPVTSPAEHKVPTRKVFIVHGRDEASKNEVALFLRTIGLEPIILHTRPHRGRHLLLKFQEESEGATFAVVLITPDDEGALVGGTPRKRARQNVVFELGFFIGKLGAPNVAALVKGDVERPSDFDGIGYIDFDPNNKWKTLLAREMHEAGIPFDASKVFTA